MWSPESVSESQQLLEEVDGSDSVSLSVEEISGETFLGLIDGKIVSFFAHS
jgi:hypothetical protein